jgi:hypothetical protein
MEEEYEDNGKSISSINGIMKIFSVFFSVKYKRNKASKETNKERSSKKSFMALLSRLTEHNLVLVKLKQNQWQAVRRQLNNYVNLQVLQMTNKQQKNMNKSMELKTFKTNQIIQHVTGWKGSFDPLSYDKNGYENN